MGNELSTNIYIYMRVRRQALTWIKGIIEIIKKKLLESTKREWQSKYRV